MLQRRRSMRILHTTSRVCRTRQQDISEGQGGVRCYFALGIISGIRYHGRWKHRDLFLDDRLADYHTVPFMQREQLCGDLLGCIKRVAG
jgi:hypothetical protein